MLAADVVVFEAVLALMILSVFWKDFPNFSVLLGLLVLLFDVEEKTAAEYDRLTEGDIIILGPTMIELGSRRPDCSFLVTSGNRIIDVPLSL